MLVIKNRMVTEWFGLANIVFGSIVAILISIDYAVTYLPEIENPSQLLPFLGSFKYLGPTGMVTYAAVLSVFWLRTLRSKKPFHEQRRFTRVTLTLRAFYSFLIILSLCMYFLPGFGFIGAIIYPLFFSVAWFATELIIAGIHHWRKSKN